MLPSVTVVIVNWNSGELLKECLLSLNKQTIQPCCVLVMDNGSTDGSDCIAEQFPGIKLHRLKFNYGFAIANNLAFDICTSDYVALLNPDAFPKSDWIEQLLTAAEANPDVAAFGSRQLVHGKKDILDGIGDVYHISGLVWREGFGRPQSLDDLISRYIFSPCAGAALYSRKSISSVGGFDQDFFCYVEDVDLGFRLRLAGYKSLYVPEAVVSHIGSGTSGGQHSDFSIYYGHRNLVWTFVKNMPGILFWALLPIHILLNILTVIYFIYLGKTGVIIRAKIDAIKGLAAILRKRSSIQNQRKASISDIWKILDKRLFKYSWR